MTTSSEMYVGVDISKERLDLAVCGEKNTTQVAHTNKGIVQIAKQMRVWKPNLIVVEATGGYEAALVLA